MTAFIAKGRIRFVASSLLGVLVLALVGCSGGPERSTEAFCSTLSSEKERILEQFNANQAAAEGTDDDLVSLLMGLGGSVQAIGELRTYFHKLADVAPEEIRIEAELVAENFDEQMESAGDAASNPLGALASGLFSSMAISGQMNTLNEFALDNCDESI